MKSKLSKKIKKIEKVLVVFVALVIFMCIFYYIFVFLDLKPKEEIVAGTTADEYQGYRDYISGTNKGVKALLENKQLNSLKFYEYDVGDDNFEGSGNPFVKSF